MIAAWSLFVPGEPKSTQTGSVIRVKGRAFPQYRNTGWSQRIALAAAAARPPALFEGPLVATLTFTRLRPASLPRRVQHPTTRPDVDNLSKKLLDVLEGIVYRDDAQLVEVTKRKQFGGRPGVEIVVRPVAG